MKAEITAEFGSFKPRAIVLDDHNASRKMISRRLRGRGFEVTECETVAEFLGVWSPGLVDLIIADWQLSDVDHGDAVLAGVRLRDWDVPFVLVSGKLGEDDRRVKVLEVLLSAGAARFVSRGENGIAKACDEGESLIERRDLTLLKVILSLRAGVLQDAVVRSSKGVVSYREQLAKLLEAPEETHRTLGALATLRSQRFLGENQ